MGFRCGIVGLPNAGKSTIFNALTKAGVPAESFPFCTIEPNVGKVAVPDERLQKLAQLLKPPKVIPAVIDFIDIAGLVKGASKGEGLGNQFLDHIRNVDAIAHIVRCFENPDVPHIDTKIEPKRDIEIVELELLLADIQTVEKRINKIKRLAKIGQKSAQIELENLEWLLDKLEKEVPAKLIPDWKIRKEQFKHLNLLTAKPTLFVANIDENMLNSEQNPYLKQVIEFASSRNEPWLSICGKLEAELMEIEDEEERREWMLELGLKELAINKLIKAGYKILDLITFYTIVGKEMRAWSIPKGTTVLKAAGKIHTDMEKGFIKAEVINYEEFIKIGSEAKARNLGLIRTEGKNYIVQDGDIIHIRFRA